MKILIAGIAAVAVILSASPVDAKGFLSGLLRGAVRAGVHAGAQSSASKTYGSDTMSVEQIEKCLGSAQELDKSSEYVDTLTSAIDAESAAITSSQQLLSRGACFCVARPPPTIGEHRKGSMLAWDGEGPCRQALPGERQCV